MKENIFYPIRLLKKTSLTGDIRSFIFEKPDGFSFQAGQFVRFKIPLESGLVLRSYSITCTPDKDYLEFCVKIIPEGSGSSWFENLKPGDTAMISPALGVFTLRKGGPKNFFIVTGVGLAPVMPMLEDAPELHAELLFGVREEKDLFWLDRIGLLKIKNKKFSHLITISRPGPDWKGISGRVTEHIKFNTDLDYYICGSLAMVKEVRKKLSENGIGSKKIHLEIF